MFCSYGQKLLNVKRLEVYETNTYVANYTFDVVCPICNMTHDNQMTEDCIQKQPIQR